MLEQRALCAAHVRVLEERRDLIEQARLPESCIPLDLQEGERALERFPSNPLEELELLRATNEAARCARSAPRGTGDRPRQERAHLLLSEDRSLERPRFRRGLEAELLGEQRTQRAVPPQSIVLAPESVEREHRPSVRPFAEAIESHRGLAVRERRVEVELRERGIGGLEMRTEHSALIAAAQVLCPDGIRLVFQHLTADERQRLLERAQSLTGRLAGRALQELVEAVEVELDQIGPEAVRLLLGDDELPRTIPVGDQVPSEDRDEGLDRGGDVLGT